MPLERDSETRPARGGTDLPAEHWTLARGRAFQYLSALRIPLCDRSGLVAQAMAIAREGAREGKDLLPATLDAIEELLDRYAPEPEAQSADLNAYQLLVWQNARFLRKHGALRTPTLASYLPASKRRSMPAADLGCRGLRRTSREHIAALVRLAGSMQLHPDKVAPLVILAALLNLRAG